MTNQNFTKLKLECLLPEARIVVFRADVVQFEDGVVGVGDAGRRLRLVHRLPAVRIHRIDLREQVKVYPQMQRSAKVVTSGFVIFVPAFLPQFACSIHATWSNDFNQSLNMNKDIHKTLERVSEL